MEEQTVRSYEEEKAAYLNSLRAYEAIHASATRRASDAYHKAIFDLQKEYEDSIYKVRQLWLELCQAEGWTP